MGSVPRIVVYCDESSHDNSPEHRFMVIGSLWVPFESRDALSKDFRRLVRDRGLRGELKWRKVSHKYTLAYRCAVDFFFGAEALRFRAIVVEQAKVDLEAFHGRDKELAFYKFYYEMLVKWLTAGCEYLVLLDRKTNRGADRYGTLQKCLVNALRGKAWISDLGIIDSHQTPLAQLCDVLTGCIAAAYNAGLQRGGAKERLIEYVARKAGWSTFATQTSLAQGKLNIFKIRLD